MNERLEDLIRDLGLTYVELARRAGVSEARVRDAIKGRSKQISQPILDLLHNDFSVNLNWLLYGTGERFSGVRVGTGRNSDDLPLHEGQIIPPKSEPSDDLPEGWIPVDTLPTIVLRYYPGGIPAGPLDLADDHYELVQVPMSGPVRPGCIMIRVRGNSMVGAGIYDGDIICVDTNQRSPEDGDVVAVTVDGESTVKYWFREGERILLCPDSEYHSPIDVTGREIIVNGLVVKVERWIKKGRRPKNGNGIDTK